MPGDLNIVQDGNGLWDGFPSKELAVEYRALNSEFATNPNAAKDNEKLKRFSELISKRRSS